MDNNPTIPKLSDLLNLHADAAARNLFCSMPGRIETYDAAKTTATVSVMMKSVNEQTGATADYAGLIDIPVLQLTGGDAGINMPITAGDPCLVIFADRDIDNWFTTGSAQPPNTRRAHSVSDGFALVGVRPLTSAVDRPDYLAAGIYRDATQISIKNNKAAIKNASTDLKAILDLIISHINSITVTTTVSAFGVPTAGTIGFGVAAPTPGDLLYAGDETTP